MEVGHACVSEMVEKMTNRIDFSKLPLINRRGVILSTDDTGNTVSESIKKRVQFSNQGPEVREYIQSKSTSSIREESNTQPPKTSGMKKKEVVWDEYGKELRRQ